MSIIDGKVRYITAYNFYLYIGIPIPTTSISILIHNLEVYVHFFIHFTYKWYILPNNLNGKLGFLQILSINFKVCNHCILF